MATPIPLSGANCHVYISHHSRVVMLLKKMWLHNHKWCGLGFYSSCCILFLTLKKSQVIKSTSTRSPHGVHLESTQTPSGVDTESLRSPQGVHTDSTRSWHEVLKESTWTYPEFTQTPGGPVGECKLQEFSHSSKSALYPLNLVRYSTTYLPFLPFFLQSAIIISTSYSGNSSKSARLRDFVGWLPNSAGESCYFSKCAIFNTGWIL